MRKWEEEMAVPAADQDYVSERINRLLVPDAPGESDRWALSIQVVTGLLNMRGTKERGSQAAWNQGHLFPHRFLRLPANGSSASSLMLRSLPNTEIVWGADKARPCRTLREHAIWERHESSRMNIEKSNLIAQSLEEKTGEKESHEFSYICYHELGRDRWSLKQVLQIYIFCIFDKLSSHITKIVLLLISESLMFVGKIIFHWKMSLDSQFDEGKFFGALLKS